MDDLALAIQQLVDSGHTLTITKPVMYIPDVATVTAIVSGPTGSRQATSNSIQDAVGQIVARIVEARLISSSGIASASSETKASLRRLGVFDELSPDSYF